MMRIAILTQAGDFAEDKDEARRIRINAILPSLENGEAVCLDFTGVRMATQSFVHACISEAIRKYEERALELLEFRGCSESVRSVIRTVVEYTVRIGGAFAPISTADIPQAEDWEKIRKVLKAVHRGKMSISEVSASTGYSPRHVQYRIKAAEIAGFVKWAGIKGLTCAGLSWLNAEPAEADKLLLDAIEEARFFQFLVPDLLDPVAPTSLEVARRIEQATGLSWQTARRRASSILRWRDAVLERHRQLQLTLVIPRRRKPVREFP